eukprot:12650-Heterococcus_DN1.PRE.1
MHKCSNYADGHELLCCCVSHSQLQRTGEQLLDESHFAVNAADCCAVYEAERKDILTRACQSGALVYKLLEALANCRVGSMR